MLKGGAFIESHQEEIHDIAKEMAAHLFGKVGVYYAETKYEGVIVRARQQFNENSKYLGWHHVIPEMNHNELVGWTGGDDRFAPVFFNTGDLHPRNYRRFEISKSAIEKKCGKVFNVSAKGDSFIERSLYLINIVDWASYYLCEMNGADIIDIEIIDYIEVDTSVIVEVPPSFHDIPKDDFTVERFNPINVVFVLDVSSSMKSADKMELMKYSLFQLSRMLRAQDKMGIVTYSSTAKVLLKPTSGANKNEINAQVEALKPSGFTAGGKGIKFIISETSLLSLVTILIAPPIAPEP